MNRILAVAACGLSLAACSSLMPSFDLPGFRSGPTTTTLAIESDPPGAEAKVPGAETCRTPCSVTVPASGDFIVNLSLNGYQPQSVTVRPVMAGGSDTGTLEPNPVFAELKPIAPPSAAAKKRPARRPRPAATAATTQAPAEPAPVPASPWPTPR